jgi:hypothetical protein
VLVLAGVVTACAAGGRRPGPGDYPERATVPPGFGLHWRVDRQPGLAVVDGVVEVWAPQQVQDVTVEVQGLDAGGRVVSRARTLATPHSFQGTDPWPFTTRLRLKGTEQRFTVGAPEYRLKIFRGGGN